jgi:hypothetical protein
LKNQLVILQFQTVKLSTLELKNLMTQRVTKAKKWFGNSKTFRQLKGKSKNSYNFYRVLTSACKKGVLLEGLWNRTSQLQTLMMHSKLMKKRNSKFYLENEKLKTYTS